MPDVITLTESELDFAAMQHIKRLLEQGVRCRACGAPFPQEEEWPEIDLCPACDAMIVKLLRPAKSRA